VMRSRRAEAVFITYCLLCEPSGLMTRDVSYIDSGDTKLTVVTFITDESVAAARGAFLARFRVLRVEKRW
jgi:hypothetical protein